MLTPTVSPLQPDARKFGSDVTADVVVAGVRGTESGVGHRQQVAGAADGEGPAPAPGRMAAETLNFGPEWLRALSSGGSVASPPPSPALPKYKLAEYRYGREEMLALYVKENKVPEEMQDKEFAAILQEEPLQPLALLPLTEEEQRNFSLSVNSVAVLRLMGKGGGAAPAGVSRGRGSARSRGRGRGETGFYQRVAAAAEEVDGAFGRGAREIHRSQSWDDRGDRRFEKPPRRDGGRGAFEEVVPGPRKEHARSDSTNWRTLHGGPRSAGWREPSGDGRRRKVETEGRRRVGSVPGEASEDDRDKDGLPEWCVDDEDEDLGTFDATGAFLSLKKSPKDLIPEEPPFAFQLLPEGPEPLQPRPPTPELVGHQGPDRDGPAPTMAPPEERLGSPPGAPWLPPSSGDVDPGIRAQPGPGAATALPPPTSAAPEFSIGDPEDDDGMKHLQQEAEKMVAALQESTVEEERFTQAMVEPRNTAAALPLCHDAARKWFYKDPQGEIQGPFTTQEMAEWFQAGYFSMSLLVKRGCDEGFQPLGEVIKMWGRVPFAPGPSPPPLLGNSRQQLAQCALQQKAAAGDLNPQQLSAFLQQLQGLKARQGEQSLAPAMSRSLSVPDTGSLWDTHTSASQPAGSDASLWDLPINSSTQGPILEQLQLQQKLQERRDAELRAKREEEKQKRREEEELFRRKQVGSRCLGSSGAEGALYAWVLPNSLASPPLPWGQ
ncbi:PERQ amino acid-rich with GYF domain-containing protein 1 [Alligator mississippiensis]|uniref:PERQ amino acid-rich with GYF domain-containing protein 1 n=1 Tax=Alligator mississippiensis TaxID=8496 RepID=A0A151M8N5_ALLMI|nr:PERQ amino acid-rich with GYF domain-containing protein 1 [Alligator mississippiensis]